MQPAPQQILRHRFPTEEELELFEHPRTKRQLIDLMNRLKNSPRHYEKRIRFLYSGISAYYAPPKKPRKEPVFKFYFNCCHLRPRLIFRQSSPEHYVLDQSSSSFIHEHPPFLPQKIRAPWGSKKHWKTVEIEKKYSQGLQGPEQDDQVKVQDPQNWTRYLNLEKSAPVHSHTAEKKALLKINLKTSPQNILENGKDLPKPSIQKADISFENTPPKQMRIEQPQKQGGRIIFSTKDKSPQQSREPSENFSSKKKIFKSKLFFGNKSKGKTLINRPWIFKPSNKLNWLQKSMCRNEEEAEEQDIQEKEHIYPIQIEEENNGSIQKNQLFKKSSEKQILSFQENKEKPKKFLQRQKTNQFESCSKIPKQKLSEFLAQESREFSSQFKKGESEKNTHHINQVEKNIPSENSNSGIQDPTVSMSKAVYHTFEWYKKFTFKLFERKMTKSLNKINLDQFRKELKNEKPFSTNQTQDKEVSRKFVIFWEESNYLLLKANNFFDFEIQKTPQIGEGYKKGISKFCNKIFISKKAQNLGKDCQNSGKLFSDTIYLGIYPINLSGHERPLEILIAYQISTKLEAKLVWFSIFLESQLYESREKEKIIIRNIMECLLKSIDFMKLSKVQFVYTTLNKRLIWGLCNAMKKIGQMNVLGGFRFSMHASCIQKLLELEKNKTQRIIDFVTYIRPAMGSPEDKENIEKSKLYFANLIKSATAQKQNQLFHPRELYQHFKSLRIDFHALPEQKNKSLDISFLNSGFYPEREISQIKDPVFEANEALTQGTNFEGFEDFFPLLLAIFNTNFNKGLKIVDQHLIVPSNFMWKENQHLICHQIFNSQQKDFAFESLFRKLFKESILDLESVVKKCPRLVTQTIYRLIYFSSLMSITHEKDYIMKEDLKSKLNGFVVKNTTKRFQVNVFETEKLQTLTKQKMGTSESLMLEFLKYSIVEEMTEQKSAKGNEVKEWRCECKFYEETGIPCEHEICSAITFRTPIYNEINQKWKALA